MIHPRKLKPIASRNRPGGPTAGDWCVDDNGDIMYYNGKEWLSVNSKGHSNTPKEVYDRRQLDEAYDRAMRGI